MAQNTNPKSQPARNSSASSAPPADRVKKAISLVEIRPGLFLNLSHIVSVRVLPQEEGIDYAILHLSNGDKLTITRSEFALITGTEPQMTARLSQQLPADH